MNSTPSISVVVPVLDEAATITRLLEALGRTAKTESCVREVIVVDGGSTDGTAAIAGPLCDLVLAEHGGLARQLNRGARAAGGNVLFFPYADSVLPPAWPRVIARTLSDHAAAGGAFRLGLESPRLRYRVIAAGANLRTAVGLGPYGDQALFVHRALFEKVQGFREDVLLEDLDLVRRLRRHGRIVIAREVVHTSARRWERGGVVATTLGNWGYLARGVLGLNGVARRAAYQRYRTASH